MQADNWLILVLIPILAWGSYGVIAKVLVNKDYLGIPTQTAGVLLIVGVMLVFGIYFLLQPQQIPLNPIVIGIGLLAGIVWAVGQLFMFLAFESGLELSRLAPLYNTNTLIAVLLGIILLKELPAEGQTLKVVVGAVLIVIGAFLVSG